MSSRFDEAILNKDIKTLQAIINNSFVIDPTTETVQKMLKRIKDNNIDIFEPHDNKRLNKDVINWTKDYERQVLNDLYFNFSLERLNLLLELVPHVEEDYIKQQGEKLSRNNKIKNDIRIEKFLKIFVEDIKYKLEKIIPREKINYILIKLGEKLIELGNKE
ncbi:hypothetical protein [Megamonas hypermegale]|uniref:hypothetical protein n=1 Tax=Megamonas hypermegale TaxID=158847 RepID=UPI0026F35E16|nr:hypothetical protein [Megamonas hypermegale]